jgi:hypothetical protein
MVQRTMKTGTQPVYELGKFAKELYLKLLEMKIA